MQCAMNGFAAILVLLAPSRLQRGPIWTCAPQKIGRRSPDGMMHRYLLRQANQAFERWKS